MLKIGNTDYSRPRVASARSSRIPNQLGPVIGFQDIDTNEQPKVEKLVTEESCERLMLFYPPPRRTKLRRPVSFQSTLST